ncbi:alpha-amylase/trypsin inhibitor-like [Oryza brachyantha]|uniref:alpha-amylase/trypsin inhibitor-like n=1 Tax=Oryza brachyantha TaxID=4533 RepID=UPI001AD9609B|nr:alpha-amylase/trypsin inhibitor-like [Oryza brachyantha]
MASKNLLHLSAAAVLLLSVIAAAAAAASYCQPGMAIPHDPLRGCRQYVRRRACGLAAGAGGRLYDWAVKERCCRELAAVPADCRCAALAYFMDGGLAASSGALEGRLLEDVPGCPRETQRELAAMLTTPGECNLETVHGGPYCLSLTDREMPKY